VPYETETFDDLAVYYYRRIHCHRRRDRTHSGGNEAMVFLEIERFIVSYDSAKKHIPCKKPPCNEVNNFSAEIIVNENTMANKLISVNTDCHCVM